LNAFAHANERFSSIVSLYQNSLKVKEKEVLMVNYISGNDLDNTLTGTGDRDRLYGFNGNDTLIGYGGHDALFGGNGSDNLVGGDGIDWLQGATGASAANDRDVLDGGRDRWTDYFVIGNQTSPYYLGSGYATLRNFNPIDDYIVIADNVALSQLRLSLEQISGSGAADTVIRMNGNVVGIVEDVNITGYSLRHNFIQSNQVNQSTWT
jgi:Ca2+-binding RTX toxin-like protein